MKHELTNEQILSGSDSLSRFGKKDIPGLTSIKIAKIRKLFASEAEIIQEEINKLIDRYAKRDEKGEIIYPVANQVSIEKPKEFQSELALITKAVITLDFDSVDINELKDTKTGQHLWSGQADDAAILLDCKVIKE